MSMRRTLCYVVFFMVALICVINAKVIKPKGDTGAKGYGDKGKDKGAGGYGGGDKGAGGYGGKVQGDKGQGGYGDEGMGGYGDQMQDQLLKATGADLTKDICPQGSKSVKKKEYQVVADLNIVLQEQGIEYIDTVRDCSLYVDQVCQQMCGMLVTKCEELTKACKEKACEDHDDAEGCIKFAEKQANTLKMINNLAWNKRQAGACDCVPQQDVSTRRKEELTTFYQTHAREQMGKVDGIFKKFSNGWPALMLTLHQKYKTAVSLVDRASVVKGEKDKDEEKPDSEDAEIADQHHTEL